MTRAIKMLETLSIGKPCTDYDPNKTPSLLKLMDAIASEYDAFCEAAARFGIVTEGPKP